MNESTDIVKQVLKHRKISEYRLAQMLGVTQPAVWKSLNQRKDMTTAKAARMLDMLDYELVARPKDGDGETYTVDPGGM